MQQKDTGKSKKKQQVQVPKCNGCGKVMLHCSCNSNSVKK